ncbi:MAG TPA: hypothetical protein VFN19_02890, partial [Candidatus Nanopelagicales bacterium]|nr:hypothetical protein [Candidatus Nanopelagicales bacterium]
PGMAALLLRGPAIDADRVTRSLTLLGGRDPYHPALPTGWTTESLRRNAMSRVGRVVQLARLARYLLTRVPGVQVSTAADLALPLDRLDPASLTLDLTGRGLSGLAAARQLRDEHDVLVTGADHRRIHLAIGDGDDVGTVRRLVVAISATGAWTPTRPGGPDPLAALPPAGAAALTPRQAWFSRTETVALHRAVGRVCTELLTPQPSGIPIVVPGEVLTAAAVGWLLEASACRVRVRGPLDRTLSTVQVVRRD